MMAEKYSNKYFGFYVIAILLFIKFIYDIVIDISTGFLQVRNFNYNEITMAFFVVITIIFIVINKKRAANELFVRVWEMLLMIMAISIIFVLLHNAYAAITASDQTMIDLSIQQPGYAIILVMATALFICLFVMSCIFKEKKFVLFAVLNIAILFCIFIFSPMWIYDADDPETIRIVVVPLLYRGYSLLLAVNFFCIYRYTEKSVNKENS